MSAAKRRAREAGIAQTILSLGVFLLMLALYGTWVGYTRVLHTKSRIRQVVTQGLATGLVTPVTQGGGYQTERYGGSQVPQWDIAGVVHEAARVAQGTVPGSQTTIGLTGYQWQLSAPDTHRWGLSGPIVVTGVQITSQAPVQLDATVTAPVAVSLWGVATIPATLHLALVIPVAGQQAPAHFQSY